MYPKTWSGLGTCYIAALSFFRNSIVSETAFSRLIFAVARYSKAFMPARQMQCMVSHILLPATPGTFGLKAGEEAFAKLRAWY
jgi:hypothetical protein